MTQNLFAACKHNGALVVRRIRLERTTQEQVSSLFSEQEEKFREGVTEESDFDGRWVPDDEELLTIAVPPEAECFMEAIVANATSIQDLNTANFLNGEIKALFIGVNKNNKISVLVQKFTASQTLEKKFSLFLDNNTFRKLTNSTFSLDSSIACIIEDEKIKFKSQSKLRSIIDMRDIYRAATDTEVIEFANHRSLAVSDANAFKAIADQTTRKLITAIVRNRILDEHDISEITAAAESVGISIQISTDGRVVMPENKADIKNLLRFLDDALYEAPLSHLRYVTNSKKPFS